jgi:protein involved in polysaccharide export with SLBB domain
MASELLVVPNIGPVNADYKLGVGDEVVIQIWGDVQKTESLIIGRNGTIAPTGIGQQRVAGLSVVETKKMLIQRFSRVYSGVRNGASNATTFVEVTPGALRQKSVIVVGEVKKPGNYLIPSTAGVVSAIAKAGGPTDAASLRNVYIRRGGAEKLDSVDLYNYFLTGKITDTTTLADFDVILVNPVDKRVVIDGAVRRPAQYELKGNETFEDLFKFSGGLLPEAYTKNILIERTNPGVERGIFTIDEENLAKILTQSNDFVLVEFIDKINNTVAIEGSVERPGLWAFSEGMKVSDLIDLAGGVLDDFFGDRIEIIRTSVNLEKEILSLNAKELLNKTGSDLELQKWDVVKVYSIWDLRFREFVDVYGEVKNPGKYFLRKGMTIQDIILLAGGFNADAYQDSVEISRITSSDIHKGNEVEYKRINISADFFKKNTDTLKHQDIVFVRKDSKKRPQEVIFLGGEFCFPGYYAKLTPDETLSNLIKRAGGFNESAYLDGTIFKRSKNDVGQVAIDFQALFNKNKKREDIILEHGDSIIAPTMPKTASVGGAVNYPASVKFVKNKSVRHYLNQAGGVTDLGKKGTIYVVRANGEVRKVKKSNSNAVNAGTQVFVVEAEIKKRDPNVLIGTVSAATSMTSAIVMLMFLISSGGSKSE